MFRHKNIIKLYEVYEDAQKIHLVFELMRGGELQSKVRLVNHLKECEAALVMKELLDAVALCHNQGVLHRDIKPRNIILRYGCCNDVARGTSWT